jgi:hypothetical protein
MCVPCSLTQNVRVTTTSVVRVRQYEGSGKWGVVHAKWSVATGEVMVKIQVSSAEVAGKIDVNAAVAALDDAAIVSDVVIFSFVDCPWCFFLTLSVVLVVLLILKLLQ